VSTLCDRLEAWELLANSPIIGPKLLSGSLMIVGTGDPLDLPAFFLDISTETRRIVEQSSKTISNFVLPVTADAIDYCARCN
jgi:hypothetical protein